MAQLHALMPVEAKWVETGEWYNVRAETVVPCCGWRGALNVQKQAQGYPCNVQPCPAPRPRVRAVLGLLITVDACGRAKRASQALIVGTNPSGTFKVRFEDGDFDDEMNERDIKPLIDPAYEAVANFRKAYSVAERNQETAAFKKHFERLADADGQITERDFRTATDRVGAHALPLWPRVVASSPRVLSHSNAGNRRYSFWN